MSHVYPGFRWYSCYVRCLFCSWLCVNYQEYISFSASRLQILRIPSALFRPVFWVYCFRVWHLNCLSMHSLITSHVFRKHCHYLSSLQIIPERQILLCLLFVKSDVVNLLSLLSSDNIVNANFQLTADTNVSAGRTWRPVLSPSWCCSVRFVLIIHHVLQALGSINVSPVFEWQTAINQSARADETHYSLTTIFI